MIERPKAPAPGVKSRSVAAAAGQPGLGCALALTLLAASCRSAAPADGAAVDAALSAADKHTCARAEPAPGKLGLHVIDGSINVPNARWLVGAKREQDSGPLKHLLIYLGNDGDLRTAPLPGSGKHHAVVSDTVVRMLDTRTRRWWSVRSEKGVPRVEAPTSLTEMPYGATVEAFASSQQRALVTLYRATAQGYRTITSLHSVPDGRELARASGASIRAGACGRRACVGHATMTSTPTEYALVALGERGIEPIRSIEGSACGTAAHWVERDRWIYARPLAHSIAIDSLHLDAPHPYNSERLQLSSWPLDTLRKATVTAQSCLELAHLRLGERNGLMIRNGDRAAFVPVSALGEPGPAELLPMLEGRFATIAPLDGAAILLELTRETSSVANGGSTRGDQGLFGTVRLLTRGRETWRGTPPRQLVVHSKPSPRPPEGALISHGPYAATVIVAPGDDARTGVWTGPCK